MSAIVKEPFGTCRLPASRELLLRLADFMPRNKLGWWGVSLLRKAALLGKKEPFDVEVKGGLRLRLYPFSNRCEKRMIAGSHLWDTPERKALADAVKAAEQGRAFTFWDVGANVGLYALSCWQAARENKKSCAIFAVEPDKTNMQRLKFNARASGAALECLQIAIGARAGEGFVTAPGKNRGEIRVEERQKGAEARDLSFSRAVPIKPLAEVISDYGLPHIDAMKIDIEGYDFAALDSFFSHAPSFLWPRLLIIECGREKSPVLELCLDKGYTLTRRTKINAILEYFERPLNMAGRTGRAENVQT